MREDITRILVPVDFSPHAESAFRYAATLARRLDARLGLLHVVEDPFVTGAWSAEIYLPNVPELLQNLVVSAQRELAVLAASDTVKGLGVETVVITGRPAHTIVEHAHKGGFDLIVMGTHGRTGLSHVVMGSVAERVLRRAPCPVLTLRAADDAEARVYSSGTSVASAMG
jgi:nucleotide-binding universal stress UspA family protein